MAIDVKIRWGGRSFVRGPSAWTGTIQYDVIGTLDPSAAEDAVMAYAGYSTDQNNPSTHPDSSLMYFSGLTPQEDGFQHFLITANFSTSNLGFFSNPNNPLNDPPIYKWGVGATDERVDVDALGNPILNTAAVPMTGATRPFSLLTWTVTRNEPVYNPNVALGFVNKCNKVAMLILNSFTVGPGQVILKSYQPVTDSTVNSPYVTCQYLFEARAPVNPSPDSADGLYDSYKTRFINQGRFGWYTKSGNTYRGFFGKVPFGTTNGFAETSEDLPLDIHGIPLQMPGETGAWKIMDTASGPMDPIACPYPFNPKVAYDTDSSTGVIFLKYVKYPPVDFGGLNL